jgi:hypothetical protein
MPLARRAHLHNLGDFFRELGRRYRRADRGELPWQDARAAAAILREMRLLLEISRFEARLAALEAQAAAEHWPVVTPSEASHARH